MATGNIEFVAHHPAFSDIAGPNPSSQLLLESPDNIPLYHEACIYHASTKSVFVTSNLLDQPDGSKHVILTRVDTNQSSSDTKIQATAVTPDALVLSCLNGGVNYEDDILMCAQGSPNPQDPSGLMRISLKDQSITPVVTSFHGIPFNSVNDVVVHPKDGSIWFTDPCYGHHQGIRQKPQLPNQVYRFDPATRSIRAVTDGFTRPNGICFSPGADIVYITDTGAIHGHSDVPINPAGPSHIYAFDLVNEFLLNRRLFAYAPGRYPDGIKCDTAGNVYSGCGDGVGIWSRDGVMLGTIKVEGGVANFCFGEEGTMFLCNETKFWKVQLSGVGVRGALLGL